MALGQLAQPLPLGADHERHRLRVIKPVVALLGAGVKANPVLVNSDLPVDKRGRVEATAALQVVGHPDVWTAGDNAVEAARSEYECQERDHACRQTLSYDPCGLAIAR